MKRCKWITNRGSRCTYKAKTKKGLCRMHFHKSVGKPGKVYNKITPMGDKTRMIATVNSNPTIIKSTNGNGHKPEIRLKTVIDWLVNKATVEELETIELVAKTTGID